MIMMIMAGGEGEMGGVCSSLLLLQSCPTPCEPMEHNPPGSSVHGIPQARLLEWVALPSSRGSSQASDQTCISYVSWIGRWVLYPASPNMVLICKSIKLYKVEKASPHLNPIHPTEVATENRLGCILSLAKYLCAHKKIYTCDFITFLSLNRS